MRPPRFLPLTITLTLLPIAACVSVDPPVGSRVVMRPLQDDRPAPEAPAVPPQERASTSSARVHHDKSGPLEVTLGGAGVSNDRVNAGSGQATGSVGWYVSEVAEVVFRQNGSFLDAGEGSSESWTGASRFAFDLHLPLGNVVPYAGANLGWVYGNGIHDSFLGGPEAGVKFYVKDDVFVLLSGEYQFFFDRSDSLNDAFDDGQILYGLSFGVRF